MWAVASVDRGSLVIPKTQERKKMSTGMSKFMAGMIVVCLLLGPGMVLADSAGGTGPGDALAPSGEWTPLTKGEEHWYSFEYQGHQETREVEDEEDEEESVWVNSNIQVLLDSEPDEGVTFSIWTPENIRMWVVGEEVEPVGRGVEDKHAPGDLCWCGTFQEAGTYYVVVEHTGQGPDTPFYTLEIRGPDVLLSAPTAMPTKTAEPAVGGEGLAIETSAPAAAGTGPDNALAPGEEWVSIPEGGVYWYALLYQGHHEFEEDEDGEEVTLWIATPVKVSLDSEPDEDMAFSVWSEGQVAAWGQGEEIEPVGRGTENKNESGDLFWAGSFGSPGRYYVVVENQGTEPGRFVLSISGEVASP
jgi:hypothetical protein